MDGLAERLVQHHEQNGGWDAARANPGFWRDMVRPGAGMGRGFPAGEPGPRPPMPMSMPMPEPRPGFEGSHGPGPGPEFPPPPGPEGGERADRSDRSDRTDRTDRPGPPPDRPFGGPWARVGLLDAQGQLISGMAPQPGAAHRVLRAANGQAIGEIVLSPVQTGQGMQRDLDRAFLAQQMGFVAWTGLAGLLLALLLSAWLTRRWLEPLTALCRWPARHCGRAAGHARGHQGRCGTGSPCGNLQRHGRAAGHHGGLAPALAGRRGA